jgi:hypothetical protein
MTLGRACSMGLEGNFTGVPQPTKVATLLLSRSDLEENIKSMESLPD